jgi:hypothetical protein
MQQAYRSEGLEQWKRKVGKADSLSEIATGEKWICGWVTCGDSYVGALLF